MGKVQWGLSHAGHSWFHLVPADSAMDPPQDTAEPIRKAGGTSVKRYLRGQKGTVRQQRINTKVVGSSRRERKVRGGAAWSEYPLQPVEEANQSRLTFLEGVSTFGGLMQNLRGFFEQGCIPWQSQCWCRKCESSGREEQICTDLNPPSHSPSALLGAAEKSGVKE